ncbi:MAG: hypothetical protein ACSLFN_09365 [Candidatus Limnocylindrales bacterium]
MSSLPRDPLDNTDRLLVDGTNLLHAMAKGEGPAPAAALIGRLRGVIPATVGIELIFDGSPGMSMRGEKVAAGLIVRYAGRRSADELLRSLVDETRAVAGPQATAGLLIVSDDHALRASLRERGARTAGSAWLLGRMARGRLASPSVGNKRPARGAGAPGSGPSAGHGPHADADAPDRPGWKPGRGATVKRGNPRKGKASSGRISE